ncbi:MULTISPECIES: hypothetical protein [unclassified Shinella]|uniref:hypothetical protein n=1 Tax=unclassified Shinella TaxID=2643062 RepID=UPI00225CF9C8|nr:MULTISPECIES: hypothetical protein [unclassified Shinella]MCO5139159.1 hypothetical protein [Shinella sp.]MDC7256111.1 hypothetical protein [Shinella sp. YE25]CAI0338951.1 conserved hypothetical protein [Rhizobiaceae bacterium]CAK7257377.1 conserved protein of unknown function [Shinella sp. WSC3-e]
MAGKSVTFVFTGPKAEDAAEALWVQYLDGGLDEEIEARLLQQGVGETEYEWDVDTRTVTISTKQ